MLGPQPSIRSWTSWVTGLRRIALVACVTGILSEGVSLWSINQKQSLIKLASAPFSETWWLAASVLIEATLLLFLFVLYRTEGLPRFSQALGLLALGAAFLRGMLTTPGLVMWIGSLRRMGSSSVLSSAHDRWTMSDSSALFAEFSNLSCILLLIAFFLHARSGRGNEGSISRSLAVITNVTVFAWGLWLLGQVVLTAYTYFAMRGYLLQQGITQAQMNSAFADAFRKLLVTATPVVAPFIVYIACAGAPPVWSRLSQQRHPQCPPNDTSGN